MILVEIYSKKDCHLCDVAKAVLRRVQCSNPFELRELLIAEGDEQYQNYKNDIPVIMINKEFAFRHRVPEKEFITKLNLLREIER